MQCKSRPRYSKAVFAQLANKKRITWATMSRTKSGALYPKDTEVDEADVLQSSVNKDVSQEACDLAWFALTKFESEGEVAKFLKKHFDTYYGVSWQCVVGKAFGSFVSVDSESYIHLQIGRTAVLLYKTYAETEYDNVAKYLNEQSVN